MNTSATLQPLQLPLYDIQLIEASAGTGKTWTIAALYLRLVLGHGRTDAEPLLPSQILVLTFTKAATAEFRAAAARTTNLREQYYLTTQAARLAASSAASAPATEGSGLRPSPDGPA